MKNFAAKWFVLLVAITGFSASVSFSQVTGDEQGQEKYSYQDGEKLIYQISSPHVRFLTSKKYETYDLRLQAGDRITVDAGGCVQTGGYGKTWKRYVDPSGPNSDRLYHGLIGLPYILRSYSESPTVQGMVRIQDVIGKEYVVPSLKDDSPESFNLRLGYEDDDYTDNGYSGHDDGTEDQCQRSVNAWVRITVTRKFAARPSAGLAGTWNFTLISNVSKAKYVGSIVLAVDGYTVTGTMSMPDRSRSAVSGTYDPATGVLSLSRDTGLQTIQSYYLKSAGNKFVGNYWNAGKYADSGYFELWKSTL